jgi:hypothetical protein
VLVDRILTVPIANPPMSHRLALRVAGLTIQVDSADVGVRVDRAAVPFQVAPSSEPDIRLRARIGDTASLPSGGRRTFDSGGVWTLDEAGDARVFRFRSTRVVDRPYKAAVISADGTLGEVILEASCFPRDRAAPVLEYPLDEVLFVNRIWRVGGVEVHGCAVKVPDGTGVLYVGHSGAGKSTMARLWAAALPGADILSDDRVVLRTEPAGARMFGTPWHGDACFARAESTPVSAIFVIRHGARNAARALTAVEASAELFARAFIPFHDPAAIDATLAVLESVARRVPLFALDVVPTSAVVGYVRDLCREAARS